MVCIACEYCVDNHMGREFSTEGGDFKSPRYTHSAIQNLSGSEGQAVNKVKVIKIISREFSTSYPQNVDNLCKLTFCATGFPKPYFICQIILFIPD